MKKIIIILVSVILLVILNGCYGKDNFKFQEGIFSYTEEAIPFTQELKISEFSFELSKITEEEYLEADGKNVIKNHYNNETYSMNLYIKFEIDSEPKHYDIQYLGKAGRTDTYKIEITLKYEEDLKGTLALRLFFSSEIGDKTKYGILAKKCKAQIIDSNLTNYENKSVETIGFPNVLYLNEKKIENEE